MSTKQARQAELARAYKADYREAELYARAKKATGWTNAEWEKAWYATEKKGRAEYSKWMESLINRVGAE